MRTIQSPWAARLQVTALIAVSLLASPARANISFTDEQSKELAAGHAVVNTLYEQVEVVTLTFAMQKNISKDTAISIGFGAPGKKRVKPRVVLLSISAIH